jgi:hypothetical protein
MNIDIAAEDAFSGCRTVVIPTVFQRRTRLSSKRLVAAINEKSIVRATAARTNAEQLPKEEKGGTACHYRWTIKQTIRAICTPTPRTPTGNDTYPELIDAAVRAGVRVLAVADHDGPSDPGDRRPEAP